ncbi:MAPK-interacting and spindle-stabilizing protein-like [Marmota monax]|uniref:MAPK-interacting and spindle-stabilizing protein-like n=1 Tax=Marmota monax TaxID=9995 RepID=UPI001EB0722C|nr:MAPK-interacting and spindle-stabilizing protein-like [Marmota monax]
MTTWRGTLASPARPHTYRKARPALGRCGWSGRRPDDTDAVLEPPTGTRERTPGWPPSPGGRDIDLERCPSEEVPVPLGSLVNFPEAFGAPPALNGRFVESPPKASDPGLPTATLTPLRGRRGPRQGLALLRGGRVLPPGLAPPGPEDERQKPDLRPAPEGRLCAPPAAAITPSPAAACGPAAWALRPLSEAPGSPPTLPWGYF